MTVLSCLALTAGAAACGSSKSSSSSPSSSSSAAAAGTSTAGSTTASSSSAPGSGGACRQLQASSNPAVTAGSTPKLSALERKALQGERTSAFQFSGRTCLATAGPAQVITLDGVASLHPNLVVDGHETIAGRNLEVRFIGSKIYTYLAEIASWPKPGLAANFAKQTAARLRQLGATREQVTSYVTSDGVARRTIAAIYKGSQLLTVSTNSSARLARSITVSPPPASKTIPYSKISG